MDSMIDNHRELADKAGLQHKHLSNEDIFKIIENNLGSTNEEANEWFLQDLKDNYQPKQQ